MNSQIFKKKKDERFYLERFRELYGGFPVGKIEGGREKPDFIVTDEEGNRLGIEVTKLYQESSEGRKPRQSLEALWWRILEKVQEKYLHSRLPHVWVTVHFDDREELRKENVGPLSDMLFEMVKRNLPFEGYTNSLKCDNSNWDIWPNAFSHVSISRYSHLTESSFYPSAGGFPLDCTPDHVRERIEDKESKISEYKKRCSCVWLLIVAPGYEVSTLFHIPETTRTCKYECSFDRVFLLQSFKKDLTELSVQKP